MVVLGLMAMGALSDRARIRGDDDPPGPGPAAVRFSPRSPLRANAGR